MMTPFERMLQVLSTGRDASSHIPSLRRLARTAAPSTGRRHRRRGGGLPAAAALEPLEHRKLLAISVYTQPGFMTVSADSGDDVFLQKVATAPYSLLVANNSSFVNDPLSERQNYSVADIDTYDRILVTSGTGRADSGVQPTGAPMAADSVTSFRLGHDRVFGLWFGRRLWEGRISIQQPSGQVTYWSFSNGGDGSTLRLASGLGVTQPAGPGDYYPLNVQVQGSFQNPVLDVRWNVPRLSQTPTLESMTWYYIDPPSILRHDDLLVQPSAAREVFVPLPNSAGLGLGPIIPETFLGTIRLDGVRYDVGMAAVGSNTLTFNGTTTGQWSRPDLADVQFTGQLVPGVTGGVRGLRLSFPSFIGPVELESARYSVSKGDGAPVSATVFAGHDITSALDVNLLQPGSTISIDSPVRAAGRPAGISLRATDINLNSRVTTDGRLDIGPARGSNARAFETAQPVAEIVDGKLTRIMLPSGYSGSGYDPDSPPVVTIAAPQSVQAEAVVESITNGVVSAIALREGGGGTGYTAVPQVTVSPPPNGRPATATAILQGTSVSSVLVTDGGTGYTTPPAVTFFAGAGSGAAADAIIVGGIGSIRIRNGGFGYAPNATLPVQFQPATGYAGSGATGFATVDGSGKIVQITVTNVGSGYTPDKTAIVIPPPPPITNPDTATAEAIVDPATTRIVGFDIRNAGSGYGNVPQVTVAPPTPALSSARPVASVSPGGSVAAIRFVSGKDLRVRINAVRTWDGAIQSITVPGGGGGSGYQVNDLIQLDSAPGGTGPRGSAAVFQVMQVSPTGAVTRLDIVGGGAGYKFGETLIHNGIATAGYGYSEAPRVFVDRPPTPDGVPATAVANIDAEGRIESITIVNPGSGYDPKLPPLVTIDQLTPLAVAETIRFNAGIGANIFEIYAANDLHTAKPRSELFVSSSASLSANELGSAPASRLFAKVISGDVFVAGAVYATAQSYLLQSDPADQSLQPFIMSTENQSSGTQTGLLRGTTLAVTMANDLPTPQSGATAFNAIAMQTQVDSVRIRAARRNGSNVDTVFPYILNVREADTLSVDAVAASTFPITIVSEAAMTFTSAISTGGGMLLDARTGTFTMTAPVSTTKGQLIVSADQINLRNSLAVTAAARDESADDIVLTAREGDVLLNGGGVSAVNRVVINQKNRKNGSWRQQAAAAGPAVIDAFRVATKTVTVDDDFVFDKVEVIVGITHSDLSDLAVTLIAPDGTRTRLVSGNARGRNFNDTVFSSDSASSPRLISSSTGPYAGTFEPLDSLSGLSGRRARGVWTLEVVDRRVASSGTLDNFVLRLNDPGTLGRGLIAGSSRITADTLEIDAEGSVGNPAVLPGDPPTASQPGFYLRTDVNVVNARVNGSFSLYDVGALKINALQPGGPVSLRADGVDPVVDAFGQPVVPAILGAMTDVTTLDVSAPRGSVNITVNTAGTLNIGNPSILGLDGSIRNAVTSDGGVRVPAMRAAGSVIIRTRGGASGGDVVLRDAPLAGSGELRARYAVSTSQLGATTYVAGNPGMFPSTLSSSANQSLPTVLQSDVRVGDRLLVTGPAGNSLGLYAVSSVGGTSAPWRLIRAAEADTSAELRPSSIVAVTDGTSAGQTFRIGYDPTKSFGTTPIQVTAAAFPTTIGSDDPNDLLTYVVSTSDGTNSASGSLGKMINLRQSNNTTGTGNPLQKSEFRFSTGISSTIRLDQELPAITKAFAIDGNQRYPANLGSASPIILDGSRIRTTRTNVPVLPATTVDAFTVRSTAGDVNSASRSASLANMTVGGFLQGSAVNIQGAPNVLVNGMTMGLDAVGKRFVNRCGVLVSAVGAANAAGTTILNCTIVGSSAAGVRVASGATGISLVGNTIGKPDADNVVGVDIQSGVNRIGVAPFATSSVAVGTILGRSVVILPATAPTTSVFIGQKITGLGIAPGTVVAGINGQTLTLSLPMTVTASSSLSFEAPGKNLIQNNLEGVVLGGIQSVVANSVICKNTFDGIRITGGSHSVGSATKTTASSNEIWGNGLWGVNIQQPVDRVRSQRIIGNYFASTTKTTDTGNGAGNVAVNGAAAAAAFGFVPNARGVDQNGNQHAGVATTGIKQQFPWRPRTR